MRLLNITHMFAGPDPFPNVGDFMPQVEEATNQHQILPPEPPNTPVSVLPKLPLAPQVIEPSNTDGI
jgi:hypothetical protein